jgi:hypothetical protein
MWTLEFWKDLGERAIKTFAQSPAAGIVAGATGLLDVEWITVLSVAGLVTLASVLTSLASAPFSTKGTASLITEVEYN